MRRILIPVLLTTAACNREITVGDLDGEIYPTPGFVLDFGVKSVGECHFAVLKLDADQGPVQILGVDVTSSTRADTFFTARGCMEFLAEQGQVSDTDLAAFDDPDGVEIKPGETYNLELGFLAPVDGYFQGAVELVTTGKPFGRGANQEPFTVDLRARAVDPCATVTPQLIDFGNVPNGAEACQDVTIRTCSALPLVVTELLINNSDFRVAEDTPFTIPGDSLYDLEICYTAPNRNKVSGNLNMWSGGKALPRVEMLANDCAGGLPYAYDVDGDGFTTCGGDCDDDDPNVNPSEIEGTVPDGKDNDCDGEADNRTRGYDDDGDGYCDDPSSCIDGSLPGDCNDGDPDVNPGETEELGNGIDDDCDGTTDSGTIDLDGDGYTEEGGDCDDDPTTGATVYPGAPELPDGIDNDCDLFKDEGTTAFDDDGDGYCEGPTCADGSTPGDCDDRYDEANPTNPNHPGAITYPGATEVVDGRDNDCNDKVDDGTERYDDDGDGYTEVGGDCDDTTDAIAPNVLEKPDNGIDDDCNPATPVGEPQ